MYVLATRLVFVCVSDSTRMERNFFGGISNIFLLFLISVYLGIFPLRNLGGKFFLPWLHDLTIMLIRFCAFCMTDFGESDQKIQSCEWYDIIFEESDEKIK